MGVRFRRSIKLLPGLRLNLSRRGLGISAGVKGAHVSTGPSGSRVSASIPGTGLYAVKSIGKKKSHPASDQTVDAPPVIHGRYYVSPWRAVFGVICAIIGPGVILSGVDSWGVLIVALLFVAGAALLLLPWLRALFTVIKNLINRTNA